ncbi:MAG: hypothetical protein ACFFD8_05855 [Candidatus Thorarchaeota archaeon]
MALKAHVNLGVLIKGLSKEELVLFEGIGKTMRHLKISTIQDINEERIVELLKLVVEKT